jgi:cobalt-zinc-cadmium efflux system outer membrane protein
MPVRCRSLLFAAAVLAAAPAVRADDAVDPVLSALIEEALDRNPAIRTASASAEAARVRPDQASGLPDPVFSIGYTNDGWSPSLGTRDMTTLALMWSQALPGPGGRRLQGDVRRAAARGAEQDVERAKLSTVAAVRRGYYGLVLARNLLELTREQETLWKDAEQSARSRYGVGLGTQHDVLRAQVEVTRIRESQIEQESDVAIRSAELNRALGRSTDAEVHTDAHLALHPLGRSLAELLEEGERVSPELKAAAAGIEGGDLSIARAQKERRPELSVQAGYMYRGGLDPMWQAGLGVSLPRRKRTGAALAEATAERRAAEERRASLALDLRLRTQERVARAVAVERIVELYSEGIVPQGRAALQAALASYQTGKLPFVTVLEALTQLYVDRAAHLRYLASHERLKAAIEEWSLEPTSEMSGPSMAGTSRMGSLGRAASGSGSSGGTNGTGGPDASGGGSMSMAR